MPSYTYECTNKECRYQFELIQSISEPHDFANCPKCSIKAKRIFSPILSMWKCNGAFGKNK